MTTPTKKAPRKAAPRKTTTAPPRKTAATAPPSKTPAKAPGTALVKAAPVKVAPVSLVKAPKPTTVTDQTTVATTGWAQWVAALKVALLVNVRSGPVMPILRAALIESGYDGTVVIRATNLENWAAVYIENDYAWPIYQDDAMAIDARQLLAAMQGLRGTLSTAQAGLARVTVSRNGERVVVSGFDRDLELNEATMPVDDFPAFPTALPDPVATFLPGVLQEALGFAATAAGRDDALLMLTGIRIEATATAISFVATDRHRLAVREIRRRHGAPFTILLPRTVLPLLGTMTGRVELRLDLKGGADRVEFRSGDTVVIARLLDASFPAWRSLLPSDAASRWTVDRKALIGDVTAARSVVERNMPIRVHFDKHQVRVEGCPTYHVENDGAGNEAWVGGFAPRLLLDGLKLFTGPTVTITGNAATKPHLLTGLRGDGEAKYMIMPVRLPG